MTALTFFYKEVDWPKEGKNYIDPKHLFLKAGLGLETLKSCAQSVWIYLEHP